MPFTRQHNFANKSLVLFIIPIVLFILAVLFEEVTGTTIEEMKLDYLFEIFYGLVMALWAAGVLFAILSFSKKEGHTKIAFLGLVLNLFVILGMLGVFKNYL